VSTSASSHAARATPPTKIASMRSFDRSSAVAWMARLYRAAARIECMGRDQ
jgi:hypothetical protein